MESYSRRKKENAKLRISMNFVLAESIAQHVGAVLDEKIKPMKPWEYYPSLFGEEEAEYKKKRSEEEFEAFKERRRKYVDEYNKKRHM